MNENLVHQSSPEKSSSSEDQRSMIRIECCIAVSDDKKSANLGEIKNISMDGCFIATQRMLPIGAVIPLVFSVEEKGIEIHPDAEIVRETHEGLGLKFIRISSQDKRRLRRYMAHLTNVTGHRNTVKNLMQSNAEHIVPIQNSTKITSLLGQCTADHTFTLIPTVQQEKYTGLYQNLEETLQLKVKEKHSLAVGDSLFVLYTLNFDTYSFQTKIIKQESNSLFLKIPEKLFYSEKRSNRRQRLHDTDKASVKIPLPWRNQEIYSYTLEDISPQGFSFRAPSEHAFFWPGTPLKGATLFYQNQEDILDGAVVRHLTALQDNESKDYIKVGVSYGTFQGQIKLASEEMIHEKKRSKWLKPFYKWADFIQSRVEYIYHSQLKKRISNQQQSPFKVLKFQNANNKPIVGLLNTSHDTDEMVRGPLIICTPGFGARKETMSALAMTIIHNLKRHHIDAAVLRFDGTNNLGESYKDVGYEGEGKHMLHYTVGGGIDDLIGALKWAKNNRYIIPTDIIILSVSFSSIATRHILTLPEGQEISKWICFMGAADAQNSIMNVSGNIDCYGNYLRGVKTGIISLLGCMVDIEYFCKDLHSRKLATISDTKRDMSQIQADILWVIGKYDAFMDSKKVHEIMSIESSGKRDIIEVHAGHVPQSSQEALAEFCLISKHILLHITKENLNTTIPSKGWLTSISEEEWKRVRHQKLESQEGYWKEYLLGEGGIGFDILAITPEYQQLVKDQMKLAQAHKKNVLDLGAGTGNISLALAMEGPCKLTSFDLIADALERTKQKVEPIMPLETFSGSCDGNELIAIRRFTIGEIELSSLIKRLPIYYQKPLEIIRKKSDEKIISFLKGNNFSNRNFLKNHGLKETEIRLLEDIHFLSRYHHQKINKNQLQEKLSPSGLTFLESNRGLPFKDKTFDVVVASLLLSYMEEPLDTLSEIYRILKPNGTLVLSSMRPDTDGSQTFMNALNFLEKCDEKDLPPGYKREYLIEAIRSFLDRAMGLIRLEEEGVFKFWDADALEEIVVQSGFENCQTLLTMGDPSQAAIVKCNRI